MSETQIYTQDKSNLEEKRKAYLGFEKKRRMSAKGHFGGRSAGSGRSKEMGRIRRRHL